MSARSATPEEAKFLIQPFLDEHVPVYRRRWRVGDLKRLYVGKRDGVTGWIEVHELQLDYRWSEEDKRWLRIASIILPEKYPVYRSKRYIGQEFALYSGMSDGNIGWIRAGKQKVAYQWSALHRKWRRMDKNMAVLGPRKHPQPFCVWD
jgi:hypothetical protein